MKFGKLKLKKSKGAGEREKSLSKAPRKEEATSKPQDNKVDLECTLLNEEMTKQPQWMPQNSQGIGQLVGHTPVQNTEYICPQKNEQLAKKIDHFLGEKDQDMSMVDTGCCMPVLKCIQGDYTGRFCYLRNCSTGQKETSGELIGGKPGYDVVLNPKNITIYLEDQRIDEVHARIFCRSYSDTNRFLIQNLSDSTVNMNTSGVWLQVPQHEIDLFQYDYLSREFSVLNELFMFKFRKVDAKIDEFNVWLTLRDLIDKKEDLESWGLSSITSFLNFDTSKVDWKAKGWTQVEWDDLKRKVQKEQRDQANNIGKRQEQRQAPNQIVLELFKQSQGGQGFSNMWKKISEYKIDGYKGFQLCTKDIKAQGQQDSNPGAFFGFEQPEFLQQACMQGFNFESDEGMVTNRKMNVFKISDPSVTQKQVSIQVYYKNESIYLISK